MMMRKKKEEKEKCQWFIMRITVIVMKTKAIKEKDLE